MKPFVHFAVGGRPSRHVLVDVDDLPLLAPHRWCSFRTGREQDIFYANTTIDGRTVYMHRFLMGEPVGMDVDHVNGDGLDNRRANLRSVSHKRNVIGQRPQQGRSSKYRGVSWNKRRQKWEASIKVDGRKRNLGLFDSEDAAAHTYDRAAFDAWGDDAYINLPETLALVS